MTKAKSGDKDAQFKVADIYSDGLKSKSNKVIVKQNHNLAYKWTEKAAANGDISALNNLGNFVCDGLGCKKDINKLATIKQTKQLKWKNIIKKVLLQITSIRKIKLKK